MFPLLDLILGLKLVQQTYIRLSLMTIIFVSFQVLHLPYGFLLISAKIPFTFIATTLLVMNTTDSEKEIT